MLGIPITYIPPTQHPAEGVAAVAWARYYDVDIVCDPCNWRAELATHTGAHHPTPWSSSRRVGLDGHSTDTRRTLDGPETWHAPLNENVMHDHRPIRTREWPGASYPP